jgi:phage I-like protein
MKLELATLSVAVELGADGEPPSEFLIFRPGLNTSLNGDYLFDEKAARDVMAAWASHGVDKMVDLEHLSLDDKAPNYDPDARAWCKLELRDGYLYGVSATWTPDGVRRLRERTQRYLSPTFPFDKETKRVKWLHNIALTAQPALDGIPALVAARANLTTDDESTGVAIMAEGDSSKAISDILKAVGMDPKMPAKVAAALGLDATATLDDIAEAIARFSAMVKKAEELLKGDPDETAEPAETGDPAPASEPAAASPDMASAAAKYEKLLAGVEQLTARMAKQDAEAAAKVEADDRAKLVAERRWPTELLEWAGDKATPLAELKRLSVKFPFVTAPVSDATSGGTTGGQAAWAHGLDERELKICKDTGCDPVTFAQLKAQREAARKG